MCSFGHTNTRFLDWYEFPPFYLSTGHDPFFGEINGGKGSRDDSNLGSIPPHYPIIND